MIPWIYAINERTPKKQKSLFLMWFWRKVTIMIILMTPSSGLRRTEENPLYRSTCREKKKEKLSVLETDVYDLFHCRKVWVLGRKKGQCNLISIVCRSELRDIRFCSTNRGLRSGNRVLNSHFHWKVVRSRCSYGLILFIIPLRDLCVCEVVLSLLCLWFCIKPNSALGFIHLCSFFTVSASLCVFHPHIITLFPLIHRGLWFLPNSLTSMLPIFPFKRLRDSCLFSIRWNDSWFQASNSFTLLLHTSESLLSANGDIMFSLHQWGWRALMQLHKWDDHLRFVAGLLGRDV